MIPILRRTSPELAGSMAFLFGLAWVCWNWSKFGALMDAIAGRNQQGIGSLLLILLPAIIAFALTTFFAILFIINRRRSKQGE